MDSFIAVKAMISIRFMIVLISLTGGILMIKYPAVEDGLRINAAIALVNTVLLSVINLIGIAGMAGETPAGKLWTVIAGTVLILLGTVKTGNLTGRERGGNG